MFAVPGWNVAAKSLVQEQSKPVKEGSKKASAQLDPTAASAKKRKRDQGTKKQGPDATGKTEGRPNNESATVSSNKKHKTQQHDARPQRSSLKQHGKGSNQKGPRKNTTTGANTEPVGTKGPRPATDSHIARSQSQNEKEKRRSADSTVDNTESSKHAQDAEHVAEHAAQPSLPPIPPAPPNLTALQAKMRAKLTSARFRHLNETLYTTPSSDALKLFSNSPDLFAEYHAGFSQQVKDSWPQNPVDVYIKTVKARGSLASPVHASAALPPLPRRKPGICTIADLGCGDAPLARGLQSVIRNLNLKLHNFDLHAPNSLVTKADISALPLRDGEVDIAVFCLSLMGTNWLAFVEEAWRILRGDGKGEVWVAEVKSRFGRRSARKGAVKVVENSVGKRRKPQAGKTNRIEDVENDHNPALVEDERVAETSGADDDTDLQPFIDSFQRRGFMLKEGSIDNSNKMFVSMIFLKAGVPKAGKWKGMKWTGKEYQRIEDRRAEPRKRFQGSQGSFPDEEIDEKEEGNILKPCVYKLR
ncbi:25S rRNA (adenine645-N1)-methyltransferase [Exophiala xenobiotica]|uniref:Ribosomal RNA-processing protein 8 n=1 Tax=Lithohypha guttulata TaxID=1690604 RepID=A0ABR0K8A7_9EURO|nr:25S rRNA (adenine645-N1)-methyltransferase [Lithohypha guttulata]KAK5314632.1 25S rRNA (adenine645-N1)-methyltransferase [Exophiala xenobiotica]